MYVCKYKYIYIYIHTYIHVCIHLRVHMYTYAHMYTQMFCIRVCIHTYIYIYIYIYTYIHTYPPYALRHNSLHRILSHRFTAAIYEAIATMDVLGFPVALAIARLLVRPSHLAIVETDVPALRRWFSGGIGPRQALGSPISPGVGRDR